MLKKPVWSKSAAVAALLLAANVLQAHAGAAVYPSVKQAAADIQAAVTQAQKEHKRVLVDFGANWCTDCRVRDSNFHKPENADLLSANFVVVHVNVGEDGITDNFSVAEQYDIPLKKGIQAMAVLDSSGKAIFSQRNGEFEAMRSMDPASVHEFLEHWKQ